MAPESKGKTVDLPDESANWDERVVGFFAEYEEYEDGAEEQGLEDVDKLLSEIEELDQKIQTYSILEPPLWIIDYTDNEEEKKFMRTIRFYWKEKSRRASQLKMKKSNTASAILQRHGRTLQEHKRSAARKSSQSEGNTSTSKEQIEPRASSPAPGPSIAGLPNQPGNTQVDETLTREELRRVYLPTPAPRQSRRDSMLNAREPTPDIAINEPDPHSIPIEHQEQVRSILLAGLGLAQRASPSPEQASPLAQQASPIPDRSSTTPTASPSASDDSSDSDFDPSPKAPAKKSGKPKKMSKASQSTTESSNEDSDELGENKDENENGEEDGEEDGDESDEEPLARSKCGTRYQPSSDSDDDESVDDELLARKHQLPQDDESDEESLARKVKRRQVSKLSTKPSSDSQKRRTLKRSFKALKQRHFRNHVEEGSVSGGETEVSGAESVSAESMSQSDTSEAQSDASEAQSDASEAQSDANEVQSDANEVQSDANEAQSDQPESDTIEAQPNSSNTGRHGGPGSRILNEVIELNQTAMEWNRRDARNGSASTANGPAGRTTRSGFLREKHHYQ